MSPATATVTVIPRPALPSRFADSEALLAHWRRFARARRAVSAVLPTDRIVRRPTTELTP